MKIYQKPRYHEKRWKELIQPLVNPDGEDRLFQDLGCNAGFYMRKAERLGYKTIGVEIDQDYIAQAPIGLNIIHGDINTYKPIPAYLTLAACIHYHQTDEQVEALFHNLMYATVNLIVMGRHKGRVTSRPDFEHLMKKLSGWKLLDKRVLGPFYSVLVKNPRYEELEIEDLYNATKEYVSGIAGFVDFVPAFEDFVRKVLSGEEFDSEKTEFVRHLKQRRLRYPLGRCWIYKVMVEDIIKNGLHTALKVRDGHIVDGYHRLVVLRELGAKRVVCRVIK